MAAAGRELWLIFRARNQASAAIRSFARDMRMITEGPKDLQMKGDALALRAAALRAKMAQQEAQIGSLINAQGSKRLGIDAQRLAIENRILATQGRQEAMGLTQQRIDIDRLRNETRIMDLSFRHGQALQNIARMSKTVKFDEGVGRYRVAGQFAAPSNRSVMQLERYKHQVELIEAQLKEAEMVSATFAERQVLLANTARELEAQLAQLNVQIARNTALGKENTAEAARRAAELRVTTGQLRLITLQQKELNAAMAEQRGEALARVSSATRSFGRSMALSGAITLGVLGLMTKGYADFATEATTAATQITNVNGSVRDVAVNAARVQKTVMDQMQRFPASAKDMTDTMYNIFSSMNTTFGQGARLLEVFNRAFEAGGMRGSLKDVSDALITLGNNWGVNAGDMNAWNRIANNTMATVRFGRLDIEKYTQTMNQLAPAFHGAHQSISEMNTAIGFLTRVIPSSRISATGLARLMEQLARSAKPLKEQFGVAITDATGNLLPLSKIIDILAKQFPQLATSGVALTNFFKTVSGTQGTIQARRALQGLILNRDAYHKVARDIARDSQELARSQEALARSPQVQFKIFTNQLKVIEYQIGAAMIPVFQHLGQILKVVTNAWNSLSKGTRDSIIHFIGYGAAAAIVLGLLTSMVGLLVGAVVIWKNFGKTVGEVARLFRPLSGGLSGAGLAEGAGEAGLIASRFGLWAGAIATLIALLPVLHHHFRGLLGAIMPLHEAIQLINAALLVMMARMVAARAIAVGLAAATGAAGLVASLGAAEIAALALAGVLAYKLTSAFFKATGASKALRGFGSAVADWMNAGGGKVSAIPSGNQMQQDIRSVKRYYNHLVAIGVDYEKRWPMIQLRFKKLNKHDLEVFFDAAVKDAEKAAPHDLPLGPSVKPSYPSTASVEAAQNAAKSKYRAFKATAVDMERELVRLQRAFEIAPTPRLAQRIETLNTAIGKLPKATQNYVAQLATMWGEVKVISDNAALAMARNVDRLRKAFERAPSARAYQAWFQANKRFTTMATSDQQAFANDMVSAHQQALEKIKAAHKAAADAVKQTWQTTLQFIRGLYNQYFSELQQSFGQLGQGPFEKGLENRVQRIRDAGSKQAQALRDQAQKIQDGAKDAEQSISATEGNLIDWGLMLDPSKMKTNTDATVKALNDRADAIEKAANARADRLAKRLSEHKLTPRELRQDLQSQVGAFETWQRHLRQLQRRGAPRELINQLRSLGPEYDNMLKGLLGMNRRQFANYVRLFSRGQRDIQKAALEQTREQLKAYRRYGRNIANAIAAGIQDEAPSVTRALTRLTRLTLGRRARQRDAQRSRTLTRQNTIHVQRNTGALQNNTRHVQRHTTRLQQNSGTIRSHGRTMQQNTRRLQTHGTRIQRNSSELANNTKAIRDNTTQLQKRPITTRPHTVHHAYVDPRRHQNPPQHVRNETNTYHYHADRSHHMSYEQWLRKQHFLHRNQRRC